MPGCDAQRAPDSSREAFRRAVPAPETVSGPPCVTVTVEDSRPIRRAKRVPRQCSPVSVISSRSLGRIGSSAIPSAFYRSPL